MSWDLEWAADNGQAGTLPTLTRSSTFTLRVAEAHVLVTGCTSRPPAADPVRAVSAARTGHDVAYFLNTSLIFSPASLSDAFF